jgi:hypothetical protein
MKEERMARVKKEDQLKIQVMKRYEALLAQKSEIDGEIKGLELYLKAVGAIRPRKRGRRKRSEQSA